jgi:hypothetical protein
MKNADQHDVSPFVVSDAFDDEDLQLACTAFLARGGLDALVTRIVAAAFAIVSRERFGACRTVFD